MENKTNLITNSLITLGLEESEGKGKGRYFQSKFIEAGIAHYDELGDILITKETLDKFIQTMVGCPVIINHKDVTDKNADKLRVGVVSKVWFNEIDGWYYCEGVLTDNQAIDLVKNQGWSVSCSYNFVSDNQKKIYHGKEIDMEFIDGEFLHLAIVESPRYEDANIVVNSKDETIFTVINETDQDLDDTSTDRWITIHPNEEGKGRPLLIKAGKTVDEAIKDKFQEWAGQSSKQQKLFDVKEYKSKTKEDFKKERKEEKENTKKENIEKYLDREITPDELEKRHPKITSEEWHDLAEKRMDRKYRERPKEETKETPKKDDKKQDDELILVQKGQYDFKTAKEKYQRYSNEVEKIKKQLQDPDKRISVKEEKELKEKLNLFDRWASEVKEEYNKQINKHPEKQEKIKLDTEKMEKAKRDSDFIRKLITNEKKDNIDKENIVMTAMNDLKDFILSVVNNACKNEVEEEEKKVETEKEKEVENEEDEKEKEEKPAENKCKNEADEDEEKIDNEEELEEKDEEKEEVIKNEEDEEEKEDKEVENKKVKNSASEMKKVVFGRGSSIQEESLYTSQAERLELGNKY